MQLMEPQQFVVGLSVAVLMSFAVRRLFRLLRKREDYHCIDEKLAKFFFVHQGDPLSSKVLGLLEVVFFFIAFAVHAPKLILVWLAFKLASKWQAGSAIVKTPEHIEGLETMYYWGARNRVAAYTLQRWLIGTLANIVAGALAFVCALYL
ncbi:MAG: hypothetical protein ABH891_07430 [Candidatus Omnitrophota bacterium]